LESEKAKSITNKLPTEPSISGTKLYDELARSKLDNAVSKERERDDKNRREAQEREDMFRNREDRIRREGIEQSDKQLDLIRFAMEMLGKK
jgi:uncharacterized caspase-like protein